jgi:hypothetical protein
MRERFTDGDAIDQDPRREDPLVYYVRGGDWLQAVGLEIDPPYEEHEATQVRSRVYTDHQARLSGLDQAAVRLVIERLVNALSKAYPQWRAWTTEWPPFVIERVGVDTLGRLFASAGWHRVHSAGAGVLSWKR